MAVLISFSDAASIDDPCGDDKKAMLKLAFWVGWPIELRATLVAISGTAPVRVSISFCVSWYLHRISTGRFGSRAIALGISRPGLYGAAAPSENKAWDDSFGERGANIALANRMASSNVVFPIAFGPTITLTLLSKSTSISSRARKFLICNDLMRIDRPRLKIFCEMKIPERDILFEL
jgi:hypothetical protein